MEKKINKKDIFKELKKKGLNINFNDVYYNVKFQFHKNGKLKINNFNKIIYKT